MQPAQLFSDEPERVRNASSYRSLHTLSPSTSLPPPTHYIITISPKRINGHACTILFFLQTTLLSLLILLQYFSHFLSLSLLPWWMVGVSWWWWWCLGWLNWLFFFSSMVVVFLHFVSPFSFSYLLFRCL